MKKNKDHKKRLLIKGLIVFAVIVFLVTCSTFYLVKDEREVYHFENFLGGPYGPFPEDENTPIRPLPDFTEIQLPSIPLDQYLFYILHINLVEKGAFDIPSHGIRGFSGWPFKYAYYESLTVSSTDSPTYDIIEFGPLAFIINFMIFYFVALILLVLYFHDTLKKLYNKNLKGR